MCCVMRWSWMRLKRMVGKSQYANADEYVSDTTM